MASTNALSLGIGHGLQGVKYSDFVQGTNAPSASDGTTDVELRWWQTDPNAAPVTRENVVLAVRAILRLIEEGAVWPAGSGTVASPPPLIGRTI